MRNSSATQRRTCTAGDVSANARYRRAATTRDPATDAKVRPTDRLIADQINCEHTTMAAYPPQKIQRCQAAGATPPASNMPQPLPTRRLGRTELTPKALGLGCAPFGGSNVDDEQVIEATHRAIELGINFVDTSPLYQQSERRMGLALEGGWREKVYLQTKTGTHPDRAYQYSAEATQWSVENSLRLLKTDYFDSVLIHDPPDIEDPLSPGRALDVLLKMKDKGIVRHVGLGMRDHGAHRRAIESGLIDIVLTFLDYTLLDQSAARTTMPLARKHDVGLILASPLGMGRLTGKQPTDDPGVLAITEWCKPRNIDILHLALQFCLMAPIDGLVLTGPANQLEIEQTFEAATTAIDPDIWRRFKADFNIETYGNSP